MRIAIDYKMDDRLVARFEEMKLRAHHKAGGYSHRINFLRHLRAKGPAVLVDKTSLKKEKDDKPLTTTHDFDTNQAPLSTSSRNFDTQPIRWDDAEVMVKKLETRPISHKQLVAEVKGIFAGLVLLESKCIEVVNAQFSKTDSKLNHEQWEALVVLHRTLLHEHHDFLLASQHPSASPALRRLAIKNEMPERLRKNGIHSFLELLHKRLPESLEHMRNFVNLAYSFTALLYETVPAFKGTWIECLGDLGTYRMAINDNDLRDREVSTSMTRYWYSKASVESPSIGRLYHKLATFAKPNTLERLFFYTKSLCVRAPFIEARSLMTFFDRNNDEISDMPILSTCSLECKEAPSMELTNEVIESLNLDGLDAGTEELDRLESASIMVDASEADLEDLDFVMVEITADDVNEVDLMQQESPYIITVALHDVDLDIIDIEAIDINTAFVRAHDLLFSGKHRDQFIAYSEAFTENLAASICRSAEQGYQISIVLSCALLEYGNRSNPVMRAIQKRRPDEEGLAADAIQSSDEIAPIPAQRFTDALEFVFRAHRAVLGLTGDDKASRYSYMHVVLVFLHHLSQFPGAMAYIEAKVPWSMICSFLNIAMESCSSVQNIKSDNSPTPVISSAQPLPEDFAQMGLLWAEEYYPDKWFTGKEIHTDEGGLPPDYMMQERVYRCLWLGCRLAESGSWLKYDKNLMRFQVDARFDVEL
ncbi:hypothetical protein CCUS01_16423 [Colletotrichum cuscutae]|uniref:DNA/RNA-binding domain-containing protein n=1 Tax=Colletotrichum cuscutae TaxID=1209917 RepID=A0AAI9VFE3_9PEZI|nr:hypothetical protein CCUS01_16423 [Colletotrichum cuscutae]